jgi:pilus assembly protein CpaC
MNWPSTIQAPNIEATFDLTTGTFGSASAIVSDQPLPHLDIAQASGWAKVMRQAAVVTANGEKAVFSGGGEVNVMVQSAVGTGIQKISFGSLIDVEPRYDSESGRMELKLHADISELESDRGTGVPGRSTTALDTLVNLDIGQSLILAGLSSKSKRRSKRGLPGLSQIPIIGFLFGTQNQAEEEVENIVIIVPTVVDAVTMQDRKRLSDALSTYKSYKGRIRDVDFVPDAKLPSESPNPEAKE